MEHILPPMESAMSGLLNPGRRAQLRAQGKAYPTQDVLRTVGHGHGHGHGHARAKRIQGQTLVVNSRFTAAPKREAETCALRLRAGKHLATRSTVGALSARLASIMSSGGALLMGVVNTTPDSFFDGGLYLDADAVQKRIGALQNEGAVIADIGGESSRPGARAVSAAEQCARIEPALDYAQSASQLAVSVDTTSPEVAEFALERGAALLNDVSCLENVELARVAARFGVPLIIMHARSKLGSMAGFSEYPDEAYADVVNEVRAEWLAARERAMACGLARELVWFDPGIGFDKNARQSLTLLQRLNEFRDLGVPIVVGPSRKSFIRAVDDVGPAERLGGTIAACLSSATRGAKILRVHDVRAVRQALRMSEALAFGGASCARGAAHA